MVALLSAYLLESGTTESTVASLGWSAVKPSEASLAALILIHRTWIGSRWWCPNSVRPCCHDGVAGRAVGAPVAVARAARMLDEAPTDLGAAASPGDGALSAYIGRDTG